MLPEVYVGQPFFALAPGVPADMFWGDVAETRTIANLWRNAVVAGHPDPAYLHESGGEWHEVAPRRRGPDGRRAGERAARARHPPKGDAFALLGRTTLEWSLFDFALGLVGAVGAPIYSSSSARDVQYVLEHSEAVGVLVEDDEQLREGRGIRRARGHVRRARRAACPRTRMGGGASRRARCPRRLDRRGRPVHVHLHVGHDRAAEGLHDPAPQLLRDGAEERRDGGQAPPARRRDAPLPPARAQLRPAAPPVGGLPRVHDRVPARPAASGGRVAAGAADDLPERPAGLREDPRRRRRRLRRAHRRAAAHRRLGARRRAARVAAAAGEAAGPAAAGRAASPRRPARLLEGEGEARRPAARRERRRRTALARHRRVLPLDRHPRAGGLRPVRSDDSGDGEPAERVQVRHGRKAAARRRAPDRRGRRDPDSLEHRLRRLLPRRRGDTRDDRRRRIRAHRRRRATSTRTGSSSSPTARRTSSSPPAGRTSRRRTSRTS